MTNISNKLLIREVEKRPALWDALNEDYKDKQRKKAAWIELTLLLLPNFKNEDEANQKLILQEIMAKWRTIRDNYVRYIRKTAETLKSGSAAKKPKLYVYGEQLTFLGKTKELRVIDSNFDNSRTSEDGVESTDYTERKIPIKESSQKAEITESFTVMHKSVDDPFFASANEDDRNYGETSALFLNATPKNRRQSLDVESASVDFMKSHNMMSKPYEEDDDIAFFYSLLPSVKCLSMDQKFTFRMHTMQFLYDLKQQPLNRPTSSFLHMNQETYLYQPAPNLPDHDSRPQSAPSATSSEYEMLNDNISSANSQ